MKYLAHVPVEQYGFISAEGDNLEEVLNEYSQIKRLVVGEGISEKEWTTLLDEYLTTGKVTNGGDVWEHMSDFQRAVCQEIKKSLKRTSKK